MRTLILGTLFVLLAGCTSSKAPKPTEVSTLQVGKPALHFDYHAVTEVLIIKNDTDTGDHWTARLVQKGEEETDWEIASGPETLIDQRADGNYIRHLLDTFSTLQVRDFARKGPLSSFGLETPRFAVRWIMRDGKEFEMRLGLAANADSQFEGVYALVSSSPTPIVVNGAALNMLSYLRTFSMLRKRNWVTVADDDVDEVELRYRNKRVFHAERGDKRWKKSDLNGLLKGLTHARIKEFIDDPAENKRHLPELQKSPLYEMVFKDRQGQPTSLRVAYRDGKLLGSISSRPNAVFDLYPETIRYFAPGKN